jgi:hypothetical protein
MEPKEKAQELYWKYYQKVADSSYPEDLSKQCALIAVDEVLYCLNMNHDNVYFYNPEYEYYKEVKQEIEKL